MAITANGYVKKTAAEWKEILIQKIKDNGYSNFTEQPADLQNMLFDTSIQVLLTLDNAIAEALNGYTPAFENQYMFLQMGKGTLNLTPKSEFKSQVILEFKGKKGDYIPAGTKVSGFSTENSVTIDTSGVVYTVATGNDEDIKEANTLTNIQTDVPAGVTATNPQPSYARIEAETFSQFKARAQELLRSPRVGAFDYAYSTIKEIEGVDSRLINFYLKEATKEINGVSVQYQGIECVVGGGEPSEVANAIFNCFLVTEKLLSMPSDDDATRTQTYSINYLDNQIFEIKYTTPKLLNLGLTLNIGFRAAPLSSVSISILFSEQLENLINTKKVGEAITHYELKKLLLDILENNGYEITNISSIDFGVSVNGNAAAWGVEDNLEELKFDCYPILTNFNIEILSSEI